MPEPRPLRGWAHSMRAYGRKYHGHTLRVESIGREWYVWVDGAPEEVAHLTMQDACERAMSLARKKATL